MIAYRFIGIVRDPPALDGTNRGILGRCQQAEHISAWALRGPIAGRIPNSSTESAGKASTLLKVLPESADGTDVSVRHKGVAVTNPAWKKREVRRTGLLPVRIYGIGPRGEKISQVACTLNISETGTRVVGLGRRLKVGDTVWLRHRQESGRFQVIWTRKNGPRQWEAGLRCLEPESRFWMMELSPGIEPESFRQLLKSALGELATASCANKKP